jgi:hypothetical protein
VDKGTPEAIAHWAKIRASPEFQALRGGANIRISATSPLSQAIWVVRSLPDSVYKTQALAALNQIVEEIST